MIWSLPAWAGSSDFSYSGRLVQTDGRPLQGPVDLEIRFFTVASGGAPVLAVSKTNVPLTQGTFQVTLSLSADDRAALFAGTGAWVEIKDLDTGKVYPRQKITAVPMAMRIPVDNSTLSWNSAGELEVNSSGNIAASSILLTNGGGPEVGITGPTGGGSAYTFVLPPNTGSTNDVLKLNADGSTSWQSANHASSHQHGGSDEIASAAPGANAIPKADGTGKLDSGWLPATAGFDTVSADSITVTNGAGPAVAITGPASGSAYTFKLPPNTGSSTDVLTLMPDGSTSWQSAGAPGAHGSTHLEGGSDPIADTTPTADMVPQADGSGKIAAGWLPLDGHSLDAADGTPVDALYVDNAGRVGIGTTDPTHGIGSYSAAAGILGITGTGAEAAASVGALSLANNRPTPTVNDNIGEIDFVSVNNSGTKVGGTIVTSLTGGGGVNGFGGSMKFSTKEDNSPTVTERMRIDHAGNVGIGTSAPGAKLEVAGQVKITGGTPAAGEVLTSDGSGLATWEPVGAPDFSDITSGTNSSGTLTVGAGGTIAAGGGVIESTVFKGSGSTSAAVDLGTSEVAGTLAVANGGTGVTTAAANLVFASPNGAAGAPSMRALVAADIPSLNALDGADGTPVDALYVDNDGKVGIGTTGPVRPLHIAGTASIVPEMQLTNAATTPKGWHLGLIGATSDTAPFAVTETGVATQFTIAPGGLIGIGPNNLAPTAPLSIRATPPANHAHIEVGEGSATDGQPSAKILLSGDGVNHGGILFTPSLTQANQKIQFTHGGSPDPGAHLPLMTIQGDGNVGVGTSSPGARLSVNDGEVYITDSNDSPRILLGDSTSGGEWGGLQWDSATDSLRLGTSAYDGPDLETMVITETGRVGIGATSPDFKLHVYSADAADTNMYVQNANGGGFAAYMGTMATGTYSAYVSIGGSQTWSAGQYGTTHFSIRDSTNAKIPFQVRVNAPTDSLVVDANGNVGIGSSTANAKLHLSDNGGGTQDTDAIIINEAWDVRKRMSFRTNNYDRGYIQWSPSNDLGLMATDFAWIGTGGTERLRLDSSGKLGIGTTDPKAKLDVAGDVRLGNSSATCESETEGSLRYNSVDKALEYCDGTSWNSVSNQKYEVILVRDEKTSGTGGGSSTATSWNVRDLNTIVEDTGNNVSLSANEITFQAGSYDCTASAPVYRTVENQLRLYNITDTAVEAVGTSQIASWDYNGNTRSFLYHSFTIASPKTFRLEHYTKTGGTDRLGAPSDSGETEIYTVLKCIRFK